jgi:uncharacterized protein
MKSLIETIVKPLVDFPDDVTITETSTNAEVKYHLTVHPEDVGKVIGKQGRIAKAIRTVVYAAGHQHGKRIYLDIQ